MTTQPKQRLQKKNTPSTSTSEDGISTSESAPTPIVRSKSSEPKVLPKHKVSEQERAISLSKDNFANNPLFAESNPNAKRNKEIYINSLSKQGYDKKGLENSSIEIDNYKKLLDQSSKKLYGKAVFDDATQREVVVEQSQQDNPEVTYDMGTALLGLNKPDDAIEMFKATLVNLDNQQQQAIPMQGDIAMNIPKLKSSKSSALFGIGSALAKKGDYEGSLEAFNDAMAESNNDEKPYETQINAYKGAAYSSAKMGDKEGAKKFLEQASVLEQVNKEKIELAQQGVPVSLSQQVGGEAVFEKEQQRQSDYMKNIADGLESAIKYPAKVAYGAAKGAVEGIVAGGEKLQKGVGQALSGESLSQIGAGALKAGTGAVSMYFNMQPGVAKFNAAVKPIEDLANAQPDNKALQVLHDATTIPFTLASHINKWTGWEPKGEAGEDLQEALDVILMIGAHKAGISGIKKVEDIGRKIAEGKGLAISEVKKINLMNDYANRLTVDELKADLAQEGTPESKKILSDIINKEQRDAQIQKDREQRDANIIEAQQKRAEAGVQDAPIIDIPQSVSIALDRMDNGEFDVQGLNEAKDHLFEEYKRLEKLKNDNGRMFTIEQINEAQFELESAFDDINNHIANENNMSAELVKLNAEKRDLQNAQGLPEDLQAEVKNKIIEVEAKIEHQVETENVTKQEIAGAETELVDLQDNIKAQQVLLDANEGNSAVEKVVGEKIAELEEAENKLKEKLNSLKPVKGFNYSEGKTSADLIGKDAMAEFDEGTYVDHVSDYSENPLEIARTFLETGTRETAKLSFQDQWIRDRGITLTEQQFADILDISELTDAIRKDFIVEERPANDYDAVLDEAGLVPEDLAQYFRRLNPEFKPKETPIKAKLKRRFKELTGMNLTPSKAKHVVDLEGRRSGVADRLTAESEALRLEKEKADYEKGLAEGTIEPYDNEHYAKEKAKLGVDKLPKYKKLSVAERFNEGLDAKSIYEEGEIHPEDVTQVAVWRSMGAKEFEGLLGGNEIGGKGAQKGGFFGDNPSIASSQKGEGKYLVEFGGKKVEGESVVEGVSLKDITGVWEFKNGVWEKLSKPEMESKIKEGGFDGKSVPKEKAKPIISTAAKNFAKKVREGKISKPDIFSSSTGGSFVWDSALEVVAKTIEVTGDVAQAIADGLVHIKESDWYKGLSDIRQKGVEDAYNEAMDKQRDKNQEQIDKDNIAAKNVVIEAKRKALGLEPLFREMKQTDAELFEEVAKIVSERNIDDMVKTAIANKRFTFTAAEQLAILRERSVIESELNDLDQKVLSGDTSAKLQEERMVKRYKIDDYDQTVMNTGTVAGQVLRARQFFINKALTERTILDRMRSDSKNVPLPKKQIELVEKLFEEKKERDKRLEDLQAEYDGARAELALANKHIEALENAKQSKSSTDIDEEVAPRKAYQRSNSKAGSLKEQLKKIYQKPIQDRNLRPELEEGEELIKSIGKEVLQDAVDNGLSPTASEWVSEVYDYLKDVDPNLTEKEIKEVLSGYGKVIEPVEVSPVVKMMKELNSQLKLMLGLEDVEGGSLPQKTLFNKAPQSPEVKVLRRMIAKAIKDAGLDTDVNNDPAKWTSAVKRVENALRNEIDLLQKQIDEEKRIGIGKRSALATTPEIDRLRFLKKIKKNALDTILRKKGVLDAEELASDKKQINKKIDTLVDAIKNETDLRKEKKGKLSDVELDELKRSKNGLQDVYDEWYSEKFKEDIAVRKLTTQIERITIANEKKLKAVEKAEIDKDYSDVQAKKKVSPDYSNASDKVKGLVGQLEKAKIEQKVANDKIFSAREDWRLANRSRGEVIFDHINNVTREGAISGSTAILKILESGLVNQIMQLPEGLLGMSTNLMVSKEIKEASTLYKNWDIGVEGRALGQFFKKETWNDAWKKFETGKHTEDEMFSDQKHHRYNIRIKLRGKTYNFNPMIFGASHGFIKTPAYKMAFSRALQYLSMQAIKDKANFDPLTMELREDVVLKLKEDAYNEALTHVMLNPNWMAKALRGVPRYLDKQTGTASAVAKVLSAGVKMNTQVLSVGLNYMTKQLNYIPGVGHLNAALPLLERKFKKDVEAITPEQANFVKRSLNAGNIGLGLFALGYFNPDMYNDEGELVIGDKKVWHWASHIPMLFTIGLGASLRKFQEADDEERSFAGETVKKVIETNPFSYTGKSFASAQEDGDAFKKLVFDQTLGRAIPQFLNEIAREQNKDEEGKQIKRIVFDEDLTPAQELGNLFKMKLPGLVKSVEEK